MGGKNDAAATRSLLMRVFFFQIFGKLAPLRKILEAKPSGLAPRMLRRSFIYTHSLFIYISVDFTAHTHSYIYNHTRSPASARTHAPIRKSRSGDLRQMATYAQQNTRP